MILREVAESTHSPAGIQPSSPSGLSLEQIKAAAAEAGLNPALVERAALRIAKRQPESLLERVAGGPIRHRETIHLATKLNEKSSTQLLSVIRAAAEVPGEGRADASGFFWHGWYRGNRLNVTGLEDSQGARVQVVLDRKAPWVNTLLVSQFVIVMALWMLLPEIDSLIDFLVPAAIPVAVLAAVRAYWKRSTRSLRERIAVLLDAVRESQPAASDAGRLQEPER